MKIVGLFPLTGNGGIASWTKIFRKTFPDAEHVFSFVDIAPSKPRTGGMDSMLYRVFSGWSALRRIKKDLKKVLQSGHYDLLHTTTSGSIGSIRDYQVAKMCKKHGVKTIMHCRYGCITEDIQSKGFIGVILRMAMKEFDQIWVLDTRSYNTLKKIDNLKDKVFLTPNSIDVSEEYDPTPKSYDTIAFCGNLIPEKGLYELVKAAVVTHVKLHIIGPGTNEVISKVKKIAADGLDRYIFLHGKMPNEEAVRFLKTVDMIGLPTYYESEAFPISIIEAMSLSKMVISCPRAAVSDMLTGLDGKPCGMLVQPKSVEAIVHAIMWCQTNKTEADVMCKKAYEKVFSAYRKEIVYDLYRRNYDRLLAI